MHIVEPKIYLVSKPQIVWDELHTYLEDIGASVAWRDDTWLADRQYIEHMDGQTLIEIMGRLCYKSWEPGLNPNVTRIRDDQAVYLGNVIESRHGSVTAHANYSFILSGVSRVFCYDEDTEVLTNRGWISWPNLRGNERFATLVGDMLVWDIATQWYELPYDGMLYQVQNEQIDLLVTPNHRMYIQPIDTQAYRRGEQPFILTEANNIFHKRVRYRKGDVTWKGESITSIKVGSTHFNASVFSRFLGYWLAEGSLRRDRKIISLTQNVGYVCDDIINTVREMGIEPSINVQDRRVTIYFTHHDLYHWIESECGRLQPDRRMPTCVFTWTSDLIENVIDTFVNGDGSVHASNNHVVAYTTSKRLADDLQTLYMMIGLSANIRIDNRVGQTHIVQGQEITNNRICYIVSEQSASRQYPHVNLPRNLEISDRWRDTDDYNDRFIPYTGKVYCVKVPSGILYVRRNGKPVWSGNTHELLRHMAGTRANENGDFSENISQESLRFVRVHDLGFMMPEAFEDEADRNLIAAHIQQAEIIAKHFIDKFQLDDPKQTFARKKQVTSAIRYIYPQGMTTDLGWTCNIRALRHIIESRTARGAEPEIRRVFGMVAERIRAETPALFADYVVNDAGEWITGNPKI